MIAIRLENKVLYPKLSIKSCIALEQLYGSPTSVIESNIPKLEDEVFLISLSLQQYNLTEDELYEVIDGLDDPLELILRLYEESGLITPNEDLEPVEAKETTSTDELEQEPQTFEEMIDSMLEQCMIIGMTENDFYNSTLAQVTRYVKSYQDKQQRDMEEKAFFDWQLANLVGISVGRLMSKNAQFPKLEEAYPFVKVSDQQQNEVGDDGLTPEEREIIINQERMRAWAEQMNAKRNRNKQEEDKQEDKEE